jgi:hypothetical protein
MKIIVTRPDENPAAFNDKVQMAMGLVYTVGYPVQFACWIMSGMKKQTYNELKYRIDQLYGQIPEAVEKRGLMHAEKLDDMKMNGINKKLIIAGYWRDMPKAEFRDMLLARKMIFSY